MNILVTGGSGFIGSHLVDGLARPQRDEVIYLDRVPRGFEPAPAGAQFVEGDFTDEGTVRRLLAARRFDVVYHAAWASIHESSIKDPAGDIAANLLPSLRLLEACRETGVRRVIFISSGGQVYGIPASQPVPESAPTHPISGYGISKLIVEKYVQMYAHLYGLETVIFRPSVPYGPRQNPHRRQGAAVVFIHHLLHDLPIEIWGDGRGVRDYFYIDDLARALVQAADSPAAAGRVMNLGGARAYSVNELLRTAETVLGKTVPVTYLDSRQFDVPDLKLDTRVAEEALGWQAQVDLPEGIRRTAAWMAEWMP